MNQTPGPYQVHWLNERYSYDVHFYATEEEARAFIKKIGRENAIAIFKAELIEEFEE